MTPCSKFCINISLLNESETLKTVMSELFFSRSFSLGHVIITTIINFIHQVFLMFIAVPVCLKAGVTVFLTIVCTLYFCVNFWKHSFLLTENLTSSIWCLTTWTVLGTHQPDTTLPFSQGAMRQARRENSTLYACFSMIFNQC